MTKRFLLTGAGFSRNWGGWLANEAFEYLLGAPTVDDYLRNLLWQNKLRSGGFEAALASVQAAYDVDPNNRTRSRLAAMTDAVVGMFTDMNKVFSKQHLEPQRGDHPNITRFLSMFDAIFTLNQDCFLEYHYLGQVRWSEHQSGSYLPYVKYINPDDTNVHPLVLDFPMAPDPAFENKADCQPYYKLHGSSNWFVERAGPRMLVVGGNKSTRIKGFEILDRYIKEFTQHLSQLGSRLMIIGYSFSDQHINEIIGKAVETGLQLFIIDPAGVDVIDKRDPRAQITQPLDPYMEKLMPRIIGASRRNLLTTFSTDRIEREKVYRFFE